MVLFVISIGHKLLGFCEFLRIFSYIGIQFVCVWNVFFLCLCVYRYSFILSLIVSKFIKHRPMLSEV